MQGEYGTLNNIVTASLTHTPVSVWGNTVFNVPILATREVPADVDVFLIADNEKVSTFNALNGKKALLLPANTYKLNSDKHTIKAGTYLSDTLNIEITNATALTDTNGYVLPLTVVKLEGEDKGIRVSSNRATAYLYVPYAFTNVDTVQTSVAGTQMSRTGWSVTVSNTTAGALGPAMLDGSNTTSWRSSNSATAAKSVVLNMGSAQSVKGFNIVPNYVAVAENATQMTISTSNDNVNWTIQGVWNGKGPASTSSAASPDIKGVNFIAPVQAQYFRFEITAWVSGSRVGIAELNAVQ
jgi:hypothetical protein